MMFPSVPVDVADAVCVCLDSGSQVTQIEEVSEGKALAPSFLKLPTDVEVQEGKAGPTRVSHRRQTGAGCE